LHVPNHDRVHGFDDVVDEEPWNPARRALDLIASHHQDGARVVIVRLDLDGSAFQHDAFRITNRLLDDVEVDALAADDVRDLLREITTIAVQAPRHVSNLRIRPGRSHRNGQDSAQQP
jgi:hypothetical protein